MWEHVFSQKRLFKVPQLITIFFQNFLNGIYLVIKEENCMIILDYKYHVELELDISL